MLKKTKTKQKQKVIKKKTKPKQNDNMSWWKEHCRWLDSFRGTTVYSKVKDVNKY